MTAGGPAAVSADLLGGGLAEDLAAASLALARRFHAGSTLCCVSPGWESHAHLIAGEFAHPVIAGKRALPALALTGPDLAAQARVAVRTGDILIAVAAARDEVAADLMRRAPAWGALSAWVGSGARPPAGAADHVLWLDDPDPATPATGRFVLLYHLLWELTHVSLDHPGLPAPAAECTDDVCITCGDEGRLAEVIAPPATAFDKALVRTAAGQEAIDVTLVAPVSAGDLVLVHAGAALSRTFKMADQQAPYRPLHDPPSAIDARLGRGRSAMNIASRSRDAAASRDKGASREEQVIERVTAMRKRRPRLSDEVVTLAHGAGGKSSAALVDAVFVEAFRNPQLEQLGDSAVLALASGERLAFSTDSFVVSPLRFNGGSIGHLAVHGTVNDLAVTGAVPQWLSAAFVIEEGLPVTTLREIVADMAAAADAAGVTLVTGDTKVVPKGAADQLYITTSGVGVIPAGRELSAHLVRPGDQVLVSGTLADHGMAVMLARGDLGIEADIASDTAPVSGMTEALLAAAPGTRWMRDPTRGGLGTVCNELAADAGVAVVLDEEALPVTPLVHGACDLLGIDPIYVACEGKFAAVVPAAEAGAALAALRAHPLGGNACLVGEVRDEPAGVVALRNAFGGTRIVDMLVGDPLPRIC